MHSPRRLCYMDSVSSLEDVNRLQSKILGEYRRVDNVPNADVGIPFKHRRLRIRGRQTSHHGNGKNVEEAHVGYRSRSPESKDEKTKDLRLRSRSPVKRLRPSAPSELTVEHREDVDPPRQCDGRVEYQDNPKDQCPAASDMKEDNHIMYDTVSKVATKCNDFASKLKMTSAIRFVGKNANPATSFDNRGTRAALELTDAHLENHDAFVWPIGEDAVVDLVIEQPGPFCIPMGIPDFSIEAEDGCLHELKIIKDTSTPLTLKIRASLSASVIDSLRHIVPPSPKEDTRVHYTPLKFHIKLDIGDRETYTVELNKTLYAKMEKKKRFDMRRIRQSFKNMKTMLPQFIRNAGRFLISGAKAHAPKRCD